MTRKTAARPSRPSPASPTLARKLFNRAQSLRDHGKLKQAESLYRQSLELRRKARAPQPADIAQSMNFLANLLEEQDRHAEAEPLYRECLASRETNCPNAWYTHYTRAMLGATLVGKRKFDEAEPLLISGYEGMRERESSIRERTKVLTEIMQNFVQLFEATSRPEQAAEWREKLALVQSAGPRRKLPWPPSPPDPGRKPPPMPRTVSEDQATANQ